MATAQGRIADAAVEFSEMHAATVVLAAEGYPGEVYSGRPIKGWDARIDEGQVIAFSHLSGVRIENKHNLVSSGGRVLSATGIAPSLGEALHASYQLIEGIDLEGSHYRKDIGIRALRS